MFVTNTHFQQKESRKWTWLSPCGLYQNMIDLILMDRRWILAVRNCHTYQGPNMETDHSLVLAKPQGKFKNTKRKITKHVNLDALRGHPTKSAFHTMLQSMLQQNAYTNDLEGMTEQVYSAVLVAAADTLLEMCKPNNPWISSETLHITDKKREAKATRLQSQAAMQKYRSLCNKLRKAT